MCPIIKIILFTVSISVAQDLFFSQPPPATKPSSYQPVALHEDFHNVVARMKAAKPE
jgi:hypothetical protein